MEAYTDFAVVYDTFMDNTPYEDWAAHIDRLLKKYGLAQKRNLVGRKGRKYRKKRGYVPRHWLRSGT